MEVIIFMENEFNGKIEKEIDELLETISGVDYGTKEQLDATNSLKALVDSLTKLKEAEEQSKLNELQMKSKEIEIEEKKKSGTREWAKIGVNVLGTLASVFVGVEAMKVLGIQKAIDEHNGDIPSLTARTQMNFIERIITTLINRKGA